MHPQKVLRAFDKHVTTWKKIINAYDIAALRMKPDAQSWSLGQACMHVIVLHDKFYMHNIRICFEGKEGASTSGKGKNAMGKIIFFFKSIPPVKVKMPEREYIEPPQPESCEQLRSELDGLSTSMASVAQQLPEADLSVRSEHPLLGMLHAGEWFEGAEFHIRHHLLQARRIMKYLDFVTA